MSEVSGSEQSKSKSSKIVALTEFQINQLRQSTLNWYDKHQRVLPWRRGADEPKEIGAEPYYVWLSEIMLQQTVVETVIPYFHKFIQKWPNIQALSRATEAEILSAWAGLGYYARARNLLTCARMIESEFDGKFPQTEAELKSLPGIGDYTAAAIMAFGFNQPAVVIDGNIERLMSRFFRISEPLPGSRSKLKVVAALVTKKERARDWPQALMDIAASLCRPKSTQCTDCPLKLVCSSAFKDDATSFPFKSTKPKKSETKTTIYLVTDGDRILVQQRPRQALLGGMLGLPHDKFHKNDIDISMLKQMFYAVSRGLTAEKYVFTHVFTHIRLEVKLLVVKISKSDLDCEWPIGFGVMPKSSLFSMPRLFQKIIPFLDIFGD